MNNRLLIVYPPTEVFEKLKMNEKFIFYKNWSFHYFDTTKKNIISVSIDDLKIEYDEILFKIDNRKKMMFVYPVLERWVRGLYDINIFHNNTHINIAKIKQFLKKHSVKKAVLYTASPHHTETAIISFSLASLNICEYYFKRIVFGAIFIKGSNLFSEREIPEFFFTNYNVTNEIDNFIKNLKLNLPPIVNQKRSWWKKNILICLILSFVVTFREIFKKKFYKINRACLQNNSINRIVFDMISQKQYLNYYNKKKIKNIDLDDISGNIIIAAHMQPEATVIPEGGHYPSNLDLVLKLRSLGFKKKIYYKEHYGSLHYFNHSVGATGVGGYRSKQYLKDLFALDVELLSFDKYITKNTKNWVVTITGTIAIERSLLGMTTIVAGQPWYKGIPGTISIDELQSDFINNLPPRPNDQIAIKAKDFLIKKLSKNYLPQLPEIVNDKVLDLHLDYFDQILKHR